MQTKKIEAKIGGKNEEILRHLGDLAYRRMGEVPKGDDGWFIWVAAAGALKKMAVRDFMAIIEIGVGTLADHLRDRARELPGDPTRAAVLREVAKEMESDTGWCSWRGPFTHAVSIWGELLSHLTAPSAAKREVA